MAISKIEAVEVAPYRVIPGLKVMWFRHIHSSDFLSPYRGGVEMTLERRKFLQQFSAACGAGLARIMGFSIGTGLMSSMSASKAGAAEALALGTAHQTVRAQVLTVVARQAINGAPWKEICAGPMQINDISVAEVEAEIMRLKIHTGKSNCYCASCIATRESIVNRFQDKLKSIPHSQASPCVCKECRSFVASFKQQQRDELESELRASGVLDYGHVTASWRKVLTG